jgi:hypothetical protein
MDEETREAASVAVLTWFCYALFVSNKNPNYAVVLLSLSAPLVGLAAVPRGSWRSPRANVFPAAVAALSLAAFAAGGASAARRIRAYAPYDRISARIDAAIPPAARVLGPQSFWLGLKDHEYRDLGGLAFRHWLTGRSGDLTEALSRYRPDVMIVDHHFRRMFLGGPTGPRPLASLLRVPLERTAVIDVGDNFGGPLEIYRLHWPVGSPDVPPPGPGPAAPAKPIPRPFRKGR